MGHLTAAVQLGFIAGTLGFALLAIADRFSPSKVFFICAIVGALFNLGVIWEHNTLGTLLVLRFATGFFLAGIYPVGMKIAADYYDKRLGRSLGFLVGALVLGTAFPHFLSAIMVRVPWRLIMIATSIVATVGGLLLSALIPDGPFRKAGGAVRVSQIYSIFKNTRFKQAAFGYVGHMWELYTFWAFVPVILIAYTTRYPDAGIPVSLFSFIIIGVGSIACVIGGILSLKIGVQKTAKTALLLSGLCCVLSPAVLFIPNSVVVILFLCFWGMVVIADSPLFSTLVAQRVEPSMKGTALTIVNCLGFAITVVSIQLLLLLEQYVSIIYLLPLLALGPLFGLIVTRDRDT